MRWSRSLARPASARERVLRGASGDGCLDNGRRLGVRRGPCIQRHPLVYFAGAQRWREEVTLQFVAAELSQELDLLTLLDAFGGDA